MRLPTKTPENHENSFQCCNNDIISFYDVDNDGGLWLVGGAVFAGLVILPFARRKTEEMVHAFMRFAMPRA